MPYNAESLGLDPTTMPVNDGDGKTRISLDFVQDFVKSRLRLKAIESLQAAGNDACGSCKYFTPTIGEDEKYGLAGVCGVVEDVEREVFNRPKIDNDYDDFEEVEVGRYEGVSPKCPDWPGILDYIIASTAECTEVPVERKSVYIQDTIYPNTITPVRDSAS